MKVAVCCSTPRPTVPLTWLRSEAMPPSPGTEEIDEGMPPAGARICCVGPVSATEVFEVPPRPG